MLSEGTATAPVTFDATPIVAAGIVLIVTALGAVLVWLTYKYLVRLLIVPIVATLARWAVDLEEKEMDSGHGEKKFNAAVECITSALGRLHLKVGAVQIRAAIVSAWTALNFNQIASAVKGGSSP